MDEVLALIALILICVYALSDTGIRRDAFYSMFLYTVISIAILVIVIKICLIH